MLLKDNQKRALKGFIESEIIDSKKLYIITGAILLGYILLSVIVDIIMLSTTGLSNSNGGTLTTGFVITGIAMFISAIVMSVGKEVKSVFVFPIDRKTYVFGNFLMFIINIVGLLILSSIAFVLEVIVFEILGSIFENFVYINSVRLEPFLIGFWISFCYILLVSTFTYLVFMLFARFKFPAVIIFVLGINLPTLFPAGREMYLKVFMFFIGEQSVLFLTLKLIVIAIVFQFLSYLAMRNLEVIK